MVGSEAVEGKGAQTSFPHGAWPLPTPQGSGGPSGRVGEGGGGTLCETSSRLASSSDSAAWSPFRTSLPASGKVQKPRGVTEMGGASETRRRPCPCCSFPWQELGRKLTQGEEGRAPCTCPGSPDTPQSGS